MVKDILIDVNSSDILMDDNLDENSLYYKTVWGNLFEEDEGGNITYLNIIVPLAYANNIKYNSDDTYSCNVKVKYYPSVDIFYIRFVTQINSVYRKISNQQIPELSQAKVYNHGDFELLDLTPAQLILINSSGYYTILFKKESVYNIPNAEVYSMTDTDFLIGLSDDQSAKLLALCAPGKNYRYPTTGVGITDYINGVVENSDLNSKLLDEFDKNKTPILDAEFDPSSGELNVSQSPEAEENDEPSTAKENLDLQLISMTNDEYIRSFSSSSVTDEVSYTDFLADIVEKNDIYCIYGLEGAKLSVLNDSFSADKGYTFVKDGFGGYYKEVAKTGYYAVTVNLKKNDIVRFKLTGDVPTVFVTKTNNIAEKEVFDTKWFNLFNKDEYGSCGIVKEECYIHYCIKADKFKTELAGVFKFNISADALKDLLVIIHDKHTSRLLGYITPNSNIYDVKMHKISGQIFLTKMINNE